MKPVFVFFSILLMAIVTSFEGYAQKKPSIPKIPLTLTAPAFEEMPIYRLQLRLTTGRKNDAGTDHAVFVQMNNRRDSFYLARGIDNFEEGTTETYDVMLRSVKKVKDIDYIRFAVNGDDGMCFKKVELLLNNCGSPVYSKSYGGDRGACFDRGSSSPTLYIAGTELRASPNWSYGLARADMWKPPVEISKAWLTSLVEAAIGNQMNMEGGDLKWGSLGNALENQTRWGPVVEIEYVNAHTVHVDLDLEVSRSGPNPEMDVDFDIIFICENGNIVTEVTNARVATDGIGTVLNFVSYGPRIGAFILNGISAMRRAVIRTPNAVEGLAGIPAGLLGLLAANLKFDAKLNLDQPGINQACREIKVKPNGDVELK